MGRPPLLFLLTKVFLLVAHDLDTEDLPLSDLDCWRPPDPSLEHWQQCQVFMAPSGEGLGWGVYAARRFQVGEIVEIAPAIIPLESDGPANVNSALYDYTYLYYRMEFIPGHRRPRVHPMSAVMYGMGMVFNHHPIAPNLEYTNFGREPSLHTPTAANAIGFRALRDIEVGEELFSSYGKNDGGRVWFAKRRMTLQNPTTEERKIDMEKLPSFVQQHCSKIAAGLGRGTWQDRILPFLLPTSRLPFWLDAQWLPPQDAEIASAYAKVDIQAGERIELGTGLIISMSRHARGTPLADLAIHWNVLQQEHQQSLRTLREEGRLKLQVNHWVDDDSWNRTDGFVSWEDVAILPFGGNVGLVDRIDESTDISDSNCRLLIPTTDGLALPIPSDEVVVVPLELIATRDIPQGTFLRLNIPYSSKASKDFADPVAQLQRELKLLGRLPPENSRYGMSNKDKNAREEL